MTTQRCLVVLLSLTTVVISKGVTKWCRHEGKRLLTYSSGTYNYPSLADAKSQCLARSDCLGITKAGASIFTLRKGWELMDSPFGEVSFVPCAGYFNCETFGLKSVDGKFLTAWPDGSVEGDTDWYREWEQFTFEQHGKDSGFLKSYHGKYLAATIDHDLEWNREHKKYLEKFTVFQHEDKIALLSYYGRYMSANPDGSVDVDKTWKQSWEWFTVHPQSCLANIECDCGKEISEHDYEMSGVEYHTADGIVESFPPEQMGYQHIDNRNSSAEQSTTFTVSETVTETSSFTNTAGASVTVGTEFSTGVPFLAEGTISVEVSAIYEYSAGEERSVEKTLQADYNCVANPGKCVTCEAMLFKYYIMVPYTQTWQHKQLPCTCTSQGMFNDVSATEMKLLVTEE